MVKVESKGQMRGFIGTGIKSTNDILGGNSFRRKIENNETLLAYLLLVPLLIIISTFFLYPFIKSFIISFFSYNLTNIEKPFIGLNNYLNIIKSKEIISSLGRTGYFTIMSVILQIILGLGIALALNLEFKGRAVMRAIVLIPWAIPSIVNGLIWKWMLHYQFGIVNYLFKSLGLISEYRNWLGEPGLSALNWVIVADVWRWTPLCAMLLLAGLQSIDKELYEAGRVDGMNIWQGFYHITLPLLRYPIMISLVLRTIDAINVFAVVYSLTGGGPGNLTKVINLYIYDEAFRYLHFGMASALSYIVTAVIAILIFIYYRSLRREVY
ncbi:MAG: sugar ABC transporter permease [Actinobacteria bacterium]|nr:sugar ABC transporter permease [Actinomycetota bacterium]